MLNKIRRLFSDPEAAARREQQRAREAAQAARAEWEEECAALESEIEDCRSYEELADEFDPEECPIITKRGEEVLLVAPGALLTETRRAPKTRYGGYSHGLSVRIAKGVYYRPSVHRGSVDAAPEETAVIDGEDGEGVFVATNQRAVFRGNRHTREFRWDKLISATPEVVRGYYVVMLPVENRQRVSGVLVGTAENADFVLRRVMFGVALHRGRGDEFIARMESELAELKAAEPPQP
jgi:Asp-tRNA(Asn)/Glu-tRNA(Gln) amidotransferase C subunit